jgi:hypothetical protein
MLRHIEKHQYLNLYGPAISPNIILVTFRPHLTIMFIKMLHLTMFNPVFSFLKWYTFWENW